MEVHFTPEQEAQLIQLATEAGTDAERLVKDIVLRLLDVKGRRPDIAPTLPIWNLGASDSFHRRDIYNDAD